MVRRTLWGFIASFCRRSLLTALCPLDQGLLRRTTGEQQSTAWPRQKKERAKVENEPKTRANQSLLSCFERLVSSMHDIVGAGLHVVLEFCRVFKGGNPGISLLWLSSSSKSRTCVLAVSLEGPAGLFRFLSFRMFKPKPLKSRFYFVLPTRHFKNHTNSEVGMCVR
jgi:hypothetical protein